MQKLNLKYFIGSFFLSLVAVFIATKAYVVMSIGTQNEPDTTAVEAKNIELFAANEESDPIYEKYKKLSAVEAPLGVDGSLATAPTTGTASNAPESSEVLYAADDNDNWIKGDETYSAQSDENILSTAFSADEAITAAADTINPQNTDDTEELKIADAATVSGFAIPLKHNFKIESGVVSVSDEADGGRIALASKNVSIYNLGTENTAAVTEPLATDSDTAESTSQNNDFTDNGEVYSQNAEDDPWEVAETSNKHLSKNTYGIKSEPLQQEVTLPDAETAQEKQTAYKVRPNILVPIPEDILNDDNLTPQFSTSQENLQLERELREKHQLPELKPENTVPAEKTTPVPAKDSSGHDVIPSIDDEKDFDTEVDETDDETSRKLSDTVAEWFGFSGKAPRAAAPEGESKATQGKKDQHSSIFQRLLGSKDDQQDIVPTELKLSFQPNRAEISGQTLEWLHAFADNAASDDNVIIEIRVDRSASHDVQQKRLKLLYKILADNGVEERKVNILFTDREPNTFIIRNVRYATDEQRIEATKHFDNPWN